MPEGERGKRASASLPISIRQLTKRYGKFTALDDVSLDITSGEFISLLGPSGSGKTTLLMVLAGFVRPDAGSVLFGEREVVLVPPHKREVGMVFQNYALFPHMSVAGNLAYPLRLRGVGKAEIAARVTRALELVQLGGLGDRHVDHLSGGQRQRVALARAVIFEPRILLMDEPLSALDKKLREQMQIEVRHLHESLGMTTVYVTHDQREALTMSDRVAVIDRGRFMQVGTPREVYDRPQTYFVADFVGESHFLPVTVREGAAFLRDQRLTLLQPLQQDASTQYLAVRPEKLRVMQDGAPDGFNRLEGRVKELVYQGDSSLLYVVLDDGAEVAVRQPMNSMTTTPSAGDLIRLGLAPADTIVVPPGPQP
jgi:putative spermidine/putrescine transport system ATP-binding protein